jgi:putative transposase
MGISQATLFRWKQLYGGLMPSEVKKLRQLEEETTRLRKVIAI